MIYEASKTLFQPPVSAQAQSWRDLRPTRSLLAAKPVPLARPTQSTDEEPTVYTDAARGINHQRLRLYSCLDGVGSGVLRHLPEDHSTPLPSASALSCPWRTPFLQHAFRVYSGSSHCYTAKTRRISFKCFIGQKDRCFISPTIFVMECY